MPIVNVPGRQPHVGTFERVRGPVVAGAVKPEDETELYEPPLFYPRRPETLANMVDAFLAEQDARTVIVMGATHTALSGVWSS